MIKILRFLDEMFNKEKTATLYNGTKVKQGDRVSWMQYDGVLVVSYIRRRERDYDLSSNIFRTVYHNGVLKKGTLFLWNPEYLITDYKTAEKL